MSILCALFGHKSLENKYNGSEYMKVRIVHTDGIGRVHAHLTAECPRCGEKYNAGSIHVPQLKGTK